MLLMNAPTTTCRIGVLGNNCPLFAIAQKEATAKNLEEPAKRHYAKAMMPWISP